MEIEKLVPDLHLQSFEHRLTQLLPSWCLGINFGKSFEFCFFKPTKHQLGNIKSLSCWLPFIKATNPRERTGEHSHEAASGFNEHVWNTVVDHPRIMDCIERILRRPDQLVRPLGACLTLNS